MTTYRIQSTPWLHAPGFVRWIEQAILPFDPNKAREFYEGLGVPPKVAEILIEPDRYFRIKYEEDSVLIWEPMEHAFSQPRDSLTNEEIDRMVQRDLCQLAVDHPFLGTVALAGPSKPYAPGLCTHCGHTIEEHGESGSHCTQCECTDFDH